MNFQDTIKELRTQIYEKNINFLIGSGASVPYFSSLGDIEKILSDEEIDEDFRMLIYLYYFNSSIRKNNELFNDELHCEYSTSKNYINFIKNLSNVMRFRNDRISPKRANIFTTNYDIFFEKAINYIQKNDSSLILNDGSHGYFDSYISAENYHKTVSRNGVFDNYHRELFSLNLIKCHGSVTWSKDIANDEDKIFLKKDLKILNNIASLADQVSLLEEDMAEIKQFLTSTENYENNKANLIVTADLNKKELQNFFEEYKKLMIINPEKTKFMNTVLNEYYYSMLRFLSYELERDQTILIVFGFSFADEHIKNLIKRSIHNPYLRIYVFAYNLEAALSIKKLLSVSSLSNIVIISPDAEMGNIDFNQFNKLMFGEI